MRALVLTLLLLNAVYFAWRQYHPAAVQPTPAEPTSSVTRLELLSERSPAESIPPMPSLAQGGGAATRSQPPERRCYTLGPVADAERAEAMRESIAAQGFGAIRRVLEQQEVAGYWVHLAPSPSRKQALAAARDLAEKGLKDYYVVGEGEHANAVSLGLFSEKFRAERRMEYVRSLGYTPELTPRYRTRQVFWLDYDEIGEAKLPESVWRLEGATESAALQRLGRDCPDTPQD